MVGGGPRPAKGLFVHAEAKNAGFSQWTLTLQTSLEGTVGERTLAGKSCRAVADAAVLTLALTLNPELKLPESTSVTIEPAATSSSAQFPLSTRTGGGPWTERGAPPSTASVPQRHNKNEQLQGLVRTRVGLRAGSVGDPHGEFGLGLGVAYEHFHSWLLSSLIVDGNAKSQVKSGDGANFWEAALASVNCYSAVSGSLDVAPCVGLDWTRVRADGYGFDKPRSGTIHWFSALLGASLGWRLHPSWWLKLDGYGLVPLRRPAAIATPGRAENLLQPQPVGAEVDLSVQFRIW